MNTQAAIRNCLNSGGRTIDEIFKEVSKVTPWVTMNKLKVAVAALKTKGILYLETEFQGKRYRHTTRGPIPKIDGMVWRYYLSNAEVPKPNELGVGWLCKYNGVYWKRLNKEAPPSPELSWEWHKVDPDDWDGTPYKMSEVEIARNIEQANVECRQNYPEAFESATNDDEGAARRDP